MCLYQLCFYLTFTFVNNSQFEGRVSYQWYIISKRDRALIFQHHSPDIQLNCRNTYNNPLKCSSTLYKTEHAFRATHWIFHWLKCCKTCKRPSDIMLQKCHQRHIFPMRRFFFLHLQHINSTALFNHLQSLQSAHKNDQTNIKF